MIKVHSTMNRTTAFTSAAAVAHGARDGRRESRAFERTVQREIRSAEKACGAPKGTLSGEIIDGLILTVRENFQKAGRFAMSQAQKLVK